MNSAGPGKVRDDTAIGKQALSHRRSYGGLLSDLEHHLE